MIYGYTIHGELERALKEHEIDEALKDLFPFAKEAHVRGQMWGRPNYVFNIINDTDYDSVNDNFDGGIKIYIETDTRAGEVIDDICAVMEHHEIKVTKVVRKWAQP